jgi:Zn-dependent peptidase ImmA (M78 family)
MNQLFAERFKAARSLSGLSLQGLADKLQNKVTRQALHKYEKGDVLPDSIMIGLLSEAMGVRPDFFFRSMQVELGPIEFRRLSKLPAKTEARLVEMVKDYLGRYLELEEIIGIATGFKSPLEGWGEVSSYEQVEDAAIEVRKQWALGCDAIGNSIALLEDKSIKVIELEADDSLEGMQAIVNKTIPVIVINTNKVKKADRKRFTAMHELGHLLLTFPPDLPEAQKELLCHKFAGAMLFPAEALLQELGAARSKLMVGELGVLKQQYGISIQAIAMRALDLGIISDNYCRQFFAFLKEMNWRIDEPVEYDGMEGSNRFDQLIFRALAEELISMSKAASLKNMKLAEFKERMLRTEPV